ncbi:Cocaine esterase [Legionella birminghamensis]|uniref:Cocaine esterase n=1 Tax=Legionella birminghamensis TaxID=28083 RepID=A0A378IB76_9GAMM|nr:CocE/NonD family hydrolase [Legionella birminghamensis]KTC71675.1 Cocaine esterase [Legionella birminghamensis]STX32487.1 Cocaine esterase [Legionella birminghamensis]
MGESRLAYILKRIKRIFLPPTDVHEPQTPMIIEKDRRIPLRDGVHISVNIYRPDDNQSHPVILCFHPYNKDQLPKKSFLGKYQPLKPYRFMRQPSSSSFSSLTGWEAPDPDFWVKNGYVLINGDMRGAGKSEGKLDLLSDTEAMDYYELIEWAADQPWSNRKVGLNGVSYLALSQYRVAALHPPHLAAICPWEGFSDIYKDLARPGGIREDGFYLFWTKMLKPEMRDMQLKQITRDSWWQSQVPDIKRIEVPALICGSFSDQSLHTQGSFRLYQEIQSRHKWLYTHRGGKWSTYYSTDALKTQLDFFDYFLKDKANGWMSAPRVRLEVRTSRNKIHSITPHSDWPLKETQWLPLYLQPQLQILQVNELETKQLQEFSLTDGNLQFSYTIPFDLQIIGPMKLRLWLELIDCKDMNLFAGIRKFHQNEEVFFEGSYGFGLDIVSKGWQKVSLRKINEEESLPWQPEHRFLEQQFLKPGEVVCVELSLLPSATFFHKGDELRLELRGNWFFKQNILLSQLSKYEPSQAGICRIHCGEEYDSCLLIPLLKPFKSKDSGE